ncbi:MAG: VOC family protein [Bacteroidota bacterium]
MPSIHTYLSFNGDCAEAFNFYKQIFGGEFQSISTFGEMPPNPQYPIAEKDKHLLMHVSLPIGDSVLMGSDSIESFGLTSPGNNFSLSINVDSREEADRVHKALSEGGAVTMTMNETFWGSYFGSLKDKFGIQWMVSFDLAKG